MMYAAERCTIQKVLFTHIYKEGESFFIRPLTSFQSSIFYLAASVLMAQGVWWKDTWHSITPLIMHVKPNKRAKKSFRTSRPSAEDESQQVQQSSKKAIFKKLIFITVIN